MKRSLKRKLLLLFCFLYIATDVGQVSLIVNAENKNESLINESIILDDKSITIAGIEDIEIEVGSSLDLLNGVKALDKNDVDITSSIDVVSNLDINKIGVYEAVYTAKDELGGSKSVTREIKVVAIKNFDIEATQEEKNNDEEKVIKEELVGDSGEKSESDPNKISKNSSKIIGVENLTVKLGENINLMDGIEAFDESGKSILDTIRVEGEVDFNRVGDYKIKYYIDRDGFEKNERERNISVVDSKNIINIYTEDEKSEERNLAFSIIFDQSKNKLSLVNKSDKVMSVKNLEKSIFKLRVLDTDNNEKATIDLLGKDRADYKENDYIELKKKIDLLKDFVYKEGDYIEIAPSDIKKGFDIKGDIVGEVTREKEDYSDGVDNEDYIRNVRFKITNKGFETVYNKAPVIEGLDDIIETDVNEMDLLKGIKVIDDHDGIISNGNIKVSTSEFKDGESIVNYSVTDSWGRSSSGNRKVKKLLNKSGSLLNLADNIITVKGMTFSGGKDIRFKILFDTSSNTIKVTERDGRIINNRYNDVYFSFKIYDRSGRLKKEVTLNGTEKSNSRKLNEIENYRYSDGDYISIYHAEADDNKLLIGGLVSGEDYSNGIPLNKIQYNRFRIEGNNLVLYENKAPIISLTSSDTLVVKRGGEVDLLKDITITDDYDTNIDKRKVVISGFDVNVVGTQTVTYTYTDSWGKTGTVTREVVVEPKNDLETISVKFMNDTGTKEIFTLKFDDIRKEIRVVERNENDTFDPSLDEVIRVSIYDQFGFVKETISLNGNETGISRKLDRFNGFKYSDGDKLSIWLKSREKGVKILGTINDPKEEYSDGFESDDKMNNVRFNIQGGKFTSIYNNGPVFSGIDDVTITRGTSFDPLLGVSVSDDLDGVILNKSIKVKFDKKAIYEIGESEVTYSVKDSWGRETTVTRKLKVNPAVTLENNIIELKDSKDEKAINIGFDYLNKKFIAEYNRNAIVDGEVSERAFLLSVYDDSLRNKYSFEITKGEYISEELVKELREQTFEVGDLVSIWSYDFSKVAIKGTVTGESFDYSNGFSDDDQMLNTRFKVTEEGLESIYNAAPVFVNFNDSINIIKDNTFNNMEGIVVNDDIDGVIDNSNVMVTGSVDTSTIGLYKVKYSITDSWGRTTEVERSVFILSKSELNSIELKNSTNETIFKIGYDSKNRRFILLNRSDNSIDDSLGSRVAFKLTLYNENSGKIRSLELNGDETGNSTKLDEILNWEVNTNYKIYLETITPKNLIINGNIIKDRLITEGDYSDGVDNADFIENVRFEITNDGFKAIYNKAPVFTINGNLNKSKGSTYDLFEGVSVNDDHDGRIDISKVTVDKKVQDLKLGNNTVVYTFVDSWGRASSKSRTINLTNGLLRNTIEFGGYDGRFNPPKSGIAFKMKIDPDSMRIKLFDRIPNMYLHTDAGWNTVYEITILDQNKNEVRKFTLAGLNGADMDTVSAMHNVPVQSGYYLRIYAFQPFRLYIKGEVVNQREDYSNAVDDMGNLDNVLFKITDNGFESVYEDRDLVGNRKSIITTTTDALQPWKIAVKSDNTLEVFDVKNHPIDWGNRNNPNAFRFIWKDDRGNTKKNVVFRGGDTSTGNWMRNNLNGQRFTSEDYFIFSSLRRDSFKISGTVLDGQEDYSNGVQVEENIRHTRFYLTNEGIRAKTNKAPVIKGAEDKSIVFGEPFDPRAGVTIEDDNDGVITSGLDITGNVDVNRYGDQYLTYRVSDSWGREGTKNRMVIVRPKLYFNQVNIDNNDNKRVLSIKTDTQSPSEGWFIVPERRQNQLDTRFELRNEPMLKIQIIKSDGSSPITLEFDGGDTGLSEKLDRIIRARYSENDKIRIWAKNNKGLKITGDILGDVTKAQEDYSDGVDNIDFMNNVAFKLARGGLTSIYNNAPVFNGIIPYKEVVKGDTSFNLKDGITVTDDHDGTINTSEVKVVSDFNINRSGLYSVEYKVTDSWGRTTISTAEVRVVSKVKDNIFEVHKDNLSKFKIVFNERTKKLNIIDKVPGILDSGLVYDFFKIKVYSINGEVKKDITIKSNKDPATDAELNELNDVVYRNGDMISIWVSNPTSIKVKGNIVGASKDYSNGFTDEEEMKNTRFMISDDGLKEVKPTTIIATGLTELVLKRGDVLTRDDLLDGVAFINPNEIINLNNVTISNLDTLTTGVKTVVYSVLDSWGNRTEFNRIVNVVEHTKLENQKIKLLNSIDNTDIFSIGFDTVNMKFTVDKAITSSDIVYNDDMIFTLNVFDSTGGNKSRFLITPSNIDSMLNNISNESFEFGDKIQVSSYDSENAVRIEWGGVIPSNPGGFNYGEIENVRFDIEDGGINGVYNEAPKIFFNGTEIKDNILPYYEFIVGDSYDFMEGITVTDDKDTVTDVTTISYDSINTNEYGAHTLTYEVIDSWGRSVKLTRDVFIRARLENYEPVFYSNATEKLFSIRFDSKELKFKAKLETTKKKSIFDIFKNSDTLTERIIVKQFDKDGVEKDIANIEFDPNNINITEVENGLNAINNMDYVYGDYLCFSTTVKESITDTTGVRDNYRIELKGINILAADGSVVEDYSDGIDDVELMDNIRFKIRENVVEPIYNYAPVLKVLNDSLVYSKGDRIDLMNGVSATDDHDSEDKIKITVNDDALQVIGNGSIIYTATDSWGRSSSVSIPIEVINGLLRNTMIFGGMNRFGPGDSGTTSIRSIVDIGFNVSGTKPKITFKKNSDHNINDDTMEGSYYTFKVFRGDDLTPVYELIIRGKHTADDIINSTLKDFEFEYGDRIKISALQPWRFRIDGYVVNQIVDYQHGVKDPEALINVEFEITDSGLTSVYSDPDYLDYDVNEEFVITYKTDGNIGLKLIYDSATKRLRNKGSRGQLAWNDKNENIPVLKFAVVNTLGVEQVSVEFTSLETYSHESFINKIKTITDYEFKPGDSIALWDLVGRISIERLQIKGNILDAKESYHDGIQDRDNFVNVRFEVGSFVDDLGKKYGLKSLFNTAPVIKGEDFTKVEKNGAFDPLAGMTVEDDKDSPAPNLVVEYNNVDLNNVGFYMVKYTATDSWGSKSEFFKDVQVYSMSTIDFKESSKGIIEVGSMKFIDKLEKETYFKTLVEVYDEEDGPDIYNRLEIENIDNLNTNRVGEYDIVYKVTDLDNNVTRHVQRFQVVKTINVSAPLSVPFQVVTNIAEPELTEKDLPHQVITNLNSSASGDTPTAFVSAVLKIINNNTSAIGVSIKEFNKKTVDGGTLDIVLADSVPDWSSLNKEDSMKKMALGVYPKLGFNSTSHTEASPIWLSSTDSITKTKIGNIAGRSVISTDKDTGVSIYGDPTKGELGLSAKYGGGFMGGKTKGKFELIFEFE